MKIQNLIAVLILFTNVSFGQKTESSNSFEQNIRLEIENESSQYFYPKLLNKIKIEPDKITKEDIKYLYYGQIYKKGTGLSFLDNSDDEDKFRRAVIQNNCKKILKLGYVNLTKNPVQLTTLIPINSCRLELKEADTYYLDSRLKMVLEIIFQTGDGKTKESAIKIANIEDDLMLKEILGFKNGKESLESSNNKVYSVWENGNQKIYFEDSWNYKYN